MDICDDASALADNFLKKSLEAVTNRVKTTANIVDGKYICVDCGDEIPEERVKAIPGCCRCVDCQEDYDKEMSI